MGCRRSRFHSNAFIDRSRCASKMSIWLMLDRHFRAEGLARAVFAVGCHARGNLRPWIHVIGIRHEVELRICPNVLELGSRWRLWRLRAARHMMLLGRVRLRLRAGFGRGKIFPKILTGRFVLSRSAEAHDPDGANYQGHFHARTIAETGQKAIRKLSAQDRKRQFKGPEARALHRPGFRTTRDLGSPTPCLKTYAGCTSSWRASLSQT